MFLSSSCLLTLVKNPRRSCGAVITGASSASVISGCAVFERSSPLAVRSSKGERQNPVRQRDKLADCVSSQETSLFGQNRLSSFSLCVRHKKTRLGRARNVNIRTDLLQEASSGHFVKKALGFIRPHVLQSAMASGGQPLLLLTGRNGAGAETVLSFSLG